MVKTPIRTRALYLFFGVLLGAALIHGAAADATAIRSRLLDPEGGIIVVAHRGCHNSFSAYNIQSAPENSLGALENCVAMGVDVMEFDVRRTVDGALVVMHDATVDRTTNGSGRIDQMTIAQICALRLRDNFGGEMAPQLTDEHPPTLREFLERAKGRIMLNLDAKEDVYDQALAEVVAAGMADQVLLKRTITSETSPPLADQLPYRQALFMPILSAKTGSPSTLAAIVHKQASASRHIPGVEMVNLHYDGFTAVRAEARKARIRLWANTLTQVGVKSVVELGGDLDGLRDPDAVWGGMIREGFSILQTDEPGPLIAWLKRSGLRHVRAEP